MLFKKKIKFSFNVNDKKIKKYIISEMKKFQIY